MTPPPRLKPPSEKEEQRAIVALFRAAGATVYSTSQYRASHVAVGLPDLWVMHPGRWCAWWFEVKRYQTPGYRPLTPASWVPLPLAEAQVDFRRQCLECGVEHFWGGRREAEDALLEFRLAARTGNGGLILIPGWER